MQRKTKKVKYSPSRPDRSCKNHGSCEWCKDNRKFSSKRRAPFESITNYRTEK